MTDFDFEPKRILKHKNHITLNEGDKYDAKVQHLEKKGDEFTELKKNEAAKKYGSKKLVRELDFKSRDELKVEESGLGNTMDWFPQILPTIEWDEYRTLLYEIDYLDMNMFFVRELYGEERTGREQILELNQAMEGLMLDIVAQLDYDADRTNDYDKEEVDGFIKVEIVKEKVETDEGPDEEYDLKTDYKQSYFSEDEQVYSGGLKEILTGICLKHDHTDEQILFSISEKDDEYFVKILNKDFTVRFNKSGGLDTGVSPWVLEMFNWDGCPINVEETEVLN